MSDDEFEEALSWDQMEESQSNSADAFVVPLDPSEDAKLSEQQYINIQERLARISQRIYTTNNAINELQQNLRMRFQQVSEAVSEADNLAGGDNPMRVNEPDDAPNNIE